jgi:AcrR family transcriptional regulator
MDRRVQKTKKQLSQALIQLILEKGYESVTVQDILDKANVGRSTFYSHYENKELLLVDGPRNLGLSLFSGESSCPGFLKLFQHVSGNVPLAKAMLGKKGGNILMDSFRSQIAEVIREHYKDRFPRTKRDGSMLGHLSQAAAAAVCSLLSSWVDSDLMFTAEEMSARCEVIVGGAFAEREI